MKVTVILRYGTIYCRTQYGMVWHGISVTFRTGIMLTFFPAGNLAHRTGGISTLLTAGISPVLRLPLPYDAGDRFEIILLPVSRQSEQMRCSGGTYTLSIVRVHASSVSQVCSFVYVTLRDDPRLRNRFVRWISCTFFVHSSSIVKTTTRLVNK